MITAKNIFRLFSVAICFLIGTSLSLSCSSDELETSPTSSTPIELSEQRVEIGCDGRYYSVSIKLYKADYSLQDIHVTTEADWIRLEADTISRDGRLTFFVKPNTDARSRDGIITINMPLTTINSEICIHQRSEAEDNSNALNGDSISRKARVGYGYNMLIDYMNPECVTEPILDYEKLVQAEQSWGTIIAEEGRATQSLNYHCSYSIEEMSLWLSKQSTTEVDFLFINKTVNKFKSTSEHDISQQTFGYSSLSKVVATRFVDEGKVQSIIRQGGDIFTNDFRKLYDHINSHPDLDSIKKLVTKFGTHLVTYADLGGRMDYSVNFYSEETSYETVEKYMKYKCGKETENSETVEASHAIIHNGGLHFDIYGGTKEARELLKSSKYTKAPDSQVDVNLLGNWLNSITKREPKSISLVRCMMQPIWQLFTNQQARIEIINHILSLAYSEAGEVGTRLQELGLDNYYQLNVTNEMLEFGDDSNSTLVKLVYFNDLPKIEICNEYVPELRGDRRVTIFYPIFHGRTNIRRGFFLGDGENAPAEVTFDNAGGCYVRPLEGYNPGEQLTTFFYIDGAFYTDNMGIAVPEVSVKVADYKADFAEGGNNYPVVKIGPGYWIRYNITGPMEFGEPVDPYDPECYDYYFYEEQRHGMLYTNVFYGNSLAYRQNHPGMFDADIDALGNRIHWYVPRVKDIHTLEAYLGKNTKALFPGMQTGFDAQFAGYYGKYDDLNNGQSFNYSEHYYGEYCFIVSKEGVTNNGEALILKPDYTLTKCHINKSRDNWYPLRAYRSSYYKYK